jgi:amidohydrolase
MNQELEGLRSRVLGRVDAVAGQLVEVSHRIHERPELNFEEHFASALLAEVASKNGLVAERGAYGLETAVHGETGSGPVVCVMSEYDALPGIGHACGHNVIAAAGLGAAIALAAVAGDAGGRLRWLGTPAEEGGGGKIIMARNGALDSAEMAMMVHSAGHDLTTIDAIALRQLEFDFEGTEAHAAAAPHRGRNALDAAVLGYMGVAALRQHILPTERVHGIFTRAGEKPNIVPKHASSQWYVRSDTMESLEELTPRVVAALEAGAHACGCTSRHRFPGETYADLLANAEMSSTWVRHAAELGRSVGDPRSGGARVVGSTDMGNVSHLVPTIHPMIASAPPDAVIHTEDFARHSRGPLADRAVVDGAKLLALCALDFWTDPALRSRTREEFARTPRSHAVL